MHTSTVGNGLRKAPMRRVSGRRRAGWRCGAGMGLLVGCTSPNAAFELGTSGQTAQETTEASSHSPITSADTPQTTSGGDSTGLTAGADRGSSTGLAPCLSPPIEPQDYPRCNEGMCDGADCIEFQPPGPVEFVMSACAVSCVEDCDCPAPPRGQAQPRCDAGSCVLGCADGRACPGSMVCADDLCLRVDAYGQCDDSCLSGFCFGFGDARGRFTDWVCPAVDCLTAGMPDDALCPPPPDGNAVPRCFEPQFPVDLQGTGWCVLSCEAGETCPEGTHCVQGDCVHPL